jgi:transketolase
MTQPPTVYGVSLRGMRAQLGASLVEIGTANDRVVVLDAETGTVTNSSAFIAAFPDRFIQMGVAEADTVSFAVGLSTTGLIPIVPLFAAFVTRRAYDQIHCQVAYPSFNVKLVGCYSGLTSPNTGATHQALQDLALMRVLPHMTVIEAADESELDQALHVAVATDGPFYIRMVRGDLDRYGDPVSPPEYRFAIGKAPVLREGADVTLVGSGLMVARCLEAATMLEAEGVSAEVINSSTIKPLDAETIERSARKTGAVVTAENHSVIGGLGGAVAEALTERYPVPMRRVGVKDRFGESAPLEELLEHYGLTSMAVAEAAMELVKARRG